MFVKTTFVYALMGALLGVVAMGIGFIKKSVPATIISAVVIVAGLSNIFATVIDGNSFVYVVLLVAFVSATAVVLNLLGKVNRMEVE